MTLYTYGEGFLYVVFVLESKWRDFCLESLMKICLKVGGMRRELLQMLRGLLYPPGHFLLNHTYWQAFSLGFFP
jgi:hypothetical protein